VQSILVDGATPFQPRREPGDAPDSRLPPGTWDISNGDSTGEPSPLPPLAFRAVVTPTSESPDNASASPTSPNTPFAETSAPRAEAASISVAPLAANTTRSATPTETVAPGLMGKADAADEPHPSKAETAVVSAQPVVRWFPSPPSEPPVFTRSPDRSAQPPAPPPRGAVDLPEVAKPTHNPVQDIKLDLGAGEGRVEVRVVDRGGEVRVAVHTPDERLAVDLREHLPSLSSRLEQSGLRAETWHAAAGAERTRAWETDSSSNSPQAGGQGHRQSNERQQDAPPKRPRVTAEDSVEQEKGNDFAWLMDALR
jgi:hypothetical protein